MRKPGFLNDPLEQSFPSRLENSPSSILFVTMKQLLLCLVKITYNAEDIFHIFHPEKCCGVYQWEWEFRAGWGVMRNHGRVHLPQAVWDLSRDSPWKIQHLDFCCTWALTAKAERTRQHLNRRILLPPSPPFLEVPKHWRRKRRKEGKWKRKAYSLPQ